jgi:hypothetical protein
MNIEEFVKNVLVSIDKAVESARSEMQRDIHLASSANQRTVEFDIAVSAESADTASGKAGVKVLQFVEAGGDLTTQSKNSTVSRIQFGIHIDSMTKAENAIQQAQFEQNRVRRNLNQAM